MTPDAASAYSAVPPFRWEGPDLTLVSRSDACVLLTGPAEPAREFAYRLHLASGWRHGPFTVIDCRRPDATLEARLFEALSDPPRTRGVIQLRLAQAGTVLLQEINRLPIGIQRALAARLLDRVDAPARFRRRLIASSSEPLFERVCSGSFDDRLYYRLNTIHFLLPSADARR